MSIWFTHVVIYQALNTLICRHVNVDVYSQAFAPLPNLLHMCTQPRGFRLRFFTGHVFGPPFTSRRHISHAAYFVFPIFFCWQAAYLGCVLFDVEGGQAPRHPGPLRSFLWCINADKSTPNMPNSSLKSIIRVSIFLKYSSCCRDREGAGQPVPNQRLREGAAHSSRGQWTASHSFWESLCTCKRTSRCEYTSSFHISYFLFLKFILKQSSRNITFQNQFPNSSISINSHLI